MPELPEVETIRIGLQKYLVGYEIIEIEVKDKKIFQGDTKNLKNSKIKAVRRFGKGLVIDLDNGYSIAAHIKLTGQFVFISPKTKKVKLSDKLKGGLPNKFTRIIFTLNKNAHLYFNDIRRFAWIKVVKTDEIKHLPFFKELGPEPFKDLTLAHFKNVILNSNQPIKVIVMDQKKIGGVGNIYANDALNQARIDPKRKGKSLTNAEIDKLYFSLLEVLKNGLKYGGTSEINYVNSLGEEGSYQKHLLVYGRKGEKCINCGGIIQKTKIGGRGTYFCPRCQK